MTTVADKPAWLVAWQTASGVTAPQPALAAAQCPAPAPSTPKREAADKRPPAPAQRAQPPKPKLAAPAGVKEVWSQMPKLGTLVVEPDLWAWDGGKRREPVLDHDHSPPRVVRSVGWRRCMRCATPFFSADVVALRLCQRCKGVKFEKPLRS